MQASHALDLFDPGIIFLSRETTSPSENGLNDPSGDSLLHYMVC